MNATLKQITTFLFSSFFDCIKVIAIVCLSFLVFTTITYEANVLVVYKELTIYNVLTIYVYINLGLILFSSLSSIKERDKQFIFIVCLMCGLAALFINKGLNFEYEVFHTILYGLYKIGFLFMYFYIYNKITSKTIKNGFNILLLISVFVWAFFELHVYGLNAFTVSRTVLVLLSFGLSLFMVGDIFTIYNNRKKLKNRN